jgi:hypothetical protein
MPLRRFLNWLIMSVILFFVISALIFVLVSLLCGGQLCDRHLRARLGGARRGDRVGGVVEDGCEEFGPDAIFNPLGSTSPTIEENMAAALVAPEDEAATLYEARRGTCRPSSPRSSRDRDASRARP